MTDGLKFEEVEPEIYGLTTAQETLPEKTEPQEPQPKPGKDKPTPAEKAEIIRARGEAARNTLEGVSKVVEAYGGMLSKTLKSAGGLKVAVPGLVVEKKAITLDSEDTDEFE